MLTLDDLQPRLGLTEWQCRRLVDAIRPVLEQMGLLTVVQGRAMQISGQAISVLERARDLSRQGIALKTLAGVVQQEIAGDSSLAQYDTSRSVQQTASIAQGPAKDDAKLIAALYERIEDFKQREADLTAERDRLLRLVEDQGEQLRALMPGRSTATNNGVGESTGHEDGDVLKKRPSRWRAFMYVIFGK